MFSPVLKLRESATCINLGSGNMWVEVRGCGTMEGDLNTVYCLGYMHHFDVLTQMLAAWNRPSKLDEREEDVTVSYDSYSQ